jgi:hypothetical protein
VNKHPQCAKVKVSFPQMLSLAVPLFFGASLCNVLAAGPIQSTTVTTRPVIVLGSNPDWTKISGVQANVLIRVQADGAVKFGPLSTTDTAVAGVEGNLFFKWIQGIFGGNWEQTISNPSRNPQMMKHVLGTSGAVNFDQGGIWIKVVKRASGQQAVPTALYYYWEKLYDPKGMTFNCPVDVYAKAHDGGRDPESRASYRDNTGSYTVWLLLSRSRKVH